MGDQNLLDVIRENARSTTDQGTRFERLALAALTEIEDYGFESVWLWHDWPDRVALGFGGDIGIDIVAHHGDSRLWAIQCKFHRGKVPSAGIERFLAVAQSCPFEKTMLVSTGALNPASQAKLDDAGTQIIGVCDVMRWESVISPASIESLTSGLVGQGRPSEIQTGARIPRSWSCPLNRNGPVDDQPCDGPRYKVYNDLRQSVTTCAVHLHHAHRFLEERSAAESNYDVDGASETEC